MVFRGTDDLSRMHANLAEELFDEILATEELLYKIREVADKDVREMIDEFLAKKYSKTPLEGSQIDSKGISVFK